MLTQIIALIVKIIAILTFLTGIYLLADNFFFINQYLEKSQEVPLLYIANLSLPFIISIVLWVFSSQTANILKPNIQDSKPLSENTLEEIQSVAFSIVGLILIVFTAAKIVSWFIWVSKFNPELHSGAQYLGLTITVLINVILGFWLLFGAKGITGLIYKLRYAGLK